MKCNTILTSAVVLALGCAGAVMGQDTEQCTSKASHLQVQIEATNLGDPDRAKLEDSLSEASTADLARCEQIVSRVQRELGATDEAAADMQSDASVNMGDSTIAPGASVAGNSPTVSGESYEEGHAAAEESLPRHPGAQENATDPASSTMQNDGYASAEQTIAKPEATDVGDNSVAATVGTSATASAGATANPLAAMSTEDLLDKPVKTANGEEVGEVDAIVIDRTTRKGHGYAVVGVGGVLGVGETQVLLDLDQLQLAADGSVRVPVTDVDDFDSYPKYDEKNFEKYHGSIGRLL